MIQDLWDQLDLQDELGQKDLQVHLETQARFRSSPFQEAQGHRANLENQGCKENPGCRDPRET